MFPLFSFKNKICTLLLRTLGVVFYLYTESVYFILLCIMSNKVLPYHWVLGLELKTNGFIILICPDILYKWNGPYDNICFYFKFCT